MNKLLQCLMHATLLLLECSRTSGNSNAIFAIPGPVSTCFMNGVFLPAYAIESLIWGSQKTAEIHVIGQRGICANNLAFVVDSGRGGETSCGARIVYRGKGFPSI